MEQFYWIEHKNRGPPPNSSHIFNMLRCVLTRTKRCLPPDPLFTNHLSFSPKSVFLFLFFPLFLSTYKCKNSRISTNVTSIRIILKQNFKAFHCEIKWCGRKEIADNLNQNGSLTLIYFMIDKFLLK